jgi:SH3-like domain-containing protein
LIEVLDRRLFIILILIVLGMTCTAGYAAAPPRMRPYTGIGLVVFSQPGDAPNQELQLPMYEEPGLSRIDMLVTTRLSGNEWIFGQQDGIPPLVVSARKGDWLRVFYDDAGREAWIDPQNKGRFQSWEQYLKLQTGRMLPGLQSQYYQLLQQPGGRLLATLTPKQVFKVLKLENAWGRVLTDQAQIGWVRWRDDDGRLLIGLGKN